MLIAYGFMWIFQSLEKLKDLNLQKGLNLGKLLKSLCFVVILVAFRGLGQKRYKQDAR